METIMEPGFTIAFISKDKKHPTFKNFKENKGQKNENDWIWNDTYNNKTKIGGYFAFYYGKKEVIIHKVHNILECTERPPEWEQSNRRVLCIGKPLMKFTWDEWKEHIGNGAPYTKDYRSTQTSYWTMNELKEKYSTFRFEYFVWMMNMIK